MNRRTKRSGGRKAAEKPVADKNKFIYIKKSCNNLSSTTFDTLEKAETGAKSMLGDGYYSSYSRSSNGDSCTIYKLVPVKRITRKASFTEESLEKATA